jgi:hypothetical protein
MPRRCGGTAAKRRLAIFSHETLSGLRGAADVNGDRRIEYSELSAFLTAANRDIANPRARPSIVVRVPALDRRAPIVDLARVEGSGRLVSGGAVTRNVEDGLDNRLADVARAKCRHKLADVRSRSCAHSTL